MNKQCPQCQAYRLHLGAILLLTEDWKNGERSGDECMQLARERLVQAGAQWVQHVAQLGIEQGPVHFVDRAGTRRFIAFNGTDGMGTPPAPSSQKRNSLSTLIELRGRKAFLYPLCLALLLISGLCTYWLIK